LYWALTGRNIATLYTINKKGENSFLVDDRITTPQEINSRVPQGLSNLVMEMISTTPKKRPADMDAVITRLELAKHVLTRELNPDVRSLEIDPFDSGFFSKPA